MKASYVYVITAENTLIATVHEFVTCSVFFSLMQHTMMYFETYTVCRFAIDIFGHLK